MTRWLFAGLAIAVVQIAAAQESATASPKAIRHISGAVLDADTGQPIDKARLQFFGVNRVPVRNPPPAVIVFTGKDGLFATEIPVDSRPMVQASAEGYITENSRAFLQCSPCDATFRLHAKAAVTGRVVAADNAEPVLDVQVEAFSFVSGELSKRSIGHVLTDSRGEFSLAQLPAGQYFLRFTPSDAIASLDLGDVEDQQSRRFLPAWWPGGAHWQQATPVAITGGSASRVPDIRLSPEARFTISGTLLPQYCHSDESFKVTILRTTNGSPKMMTSALVSCGADYAFSDLTPGSYQIAMDESAGQIPPSIDIRIGSENVRADLPATEHPAAPATP